MPLAIQTVLDAALDGRDWQTAAQCILANPVSCKFTPTLLKPLAQIALKTDLQSPVPSQAKFVRRVARLVDKMEALHACKS